MVTSFTICAYYELACKWKCLLNETHSDNIIAIYFFLHNAFNLHVWFVTISDTNMGIWGITAHEWTFSNKLEIWTGFACSHVRMLRPQSYIRLLARCLSNFMPLSRNGIEIISWFQLHSSNGVCTGTVAMRVRWAVFGGNYNVNFESIYTAGLDLCLELQFVMRKRNNTNNNNNTIHINTNPFHLNVWIAPKIALIVSNSASTTFPCNLPPAQWLALSCAPHGFCTYTHFPAVSCFSYSWHLIVETNTTQNAKHLAGDSCVLVLSCFIINQESGFKFFNIFELNLWFHVFFFLY